MREGLAFSAVFVSLAVLIGSDVDQSVKWLTVGIVMVVGVIFWKKPLFRDGIARQQAKRAWKAWRDSLPTGDRLAVEDAELGRHRTRSPEGRAAHSGTKFGRTLTRLLAQARRVGFPTLAAGLSGE